MARVTKRSIVNSLPSGNVGGNGGSDSGVKIKVTQYVKPTVAQVVASRALEAEDEFRPYYADDALGAGMSSIEPQYNPAVLQQVCSENNTLGPCIDAMEVNIDGTGYVIEKEGDAADEDDPEIKRLEEFFDEVFPGLSILQLRRKVRRDLEQTGNGYIEVLRNAAGAVVFLRHVASRTIRVMRLDGPIVVTKTIKRNGGDVAIPTLVRERRYAQMIGATWIYFREFGSVRQINLQTGWWESEDRPVAFGNRGTEIIHLKVNDHYYTPYGLPRWEGQIPSVLGSRRAEEFNLDYFETGGLPPALITITGGSMTEDAHRSLETQFNSKSRSKHRVAILEAQSTSGSVDDAGKVEVKVERFGSDREHDALFQEYDDRCHIRTRRSFRLPPLFVGDIDKIPFAVAYTAFLVAENQVFRPEREAFDDMIARMIMPEIGGKGYIFRSKNLSVADIQTKLAGLQVASATQHVDPVDVVHTVNEVCDLDLRPTDQPIPPPPGPPGQEPDIREAGFNVGGGPGVIRPKIGVTPGTVKPMTTPSATTPKSGPTNPGNPYSPVQKTDMSVLMLADQATAALRRKDFATLRKIIQQVDALSGPQQGSFQAAMALRSYFDPSIDPEGMTDLAGCSLAAMIVSGALE